jgi:hypothetical protein
VTYSRVRSFEVIPSFIFSTGIESGKNLYNQLTKGSFMKLHILATTLFFALNVMAKEKKHEHREHGAHEHGAGTLAIAFDDTKGKIEFKGAAEGILGFEHKPKNKKDEKAVADAVAHFENEIGKMVQMDSTLGCQFTKELIGQVPEEGEKGSGEHSDWAANFTIACAKSPMGTKIVIDFSSFKLLKDMDITVLAGSVQKSAEFKKKPVTIELK